MAKIGTVQVEVTPVANEAKWEEVCKHIEDRVAAAVRRGFAKGLEPETPAMSYIVNIEGVIPPPSGSPEFTAPVRRI